MDHLLFLFFWPIVRIFFKFNLIKNPFCYFSISSSNSKSPIRQIICMYLQKKSSKKFF